MGWRSHLFVSWRSKEVYKRTFSWTSKFFGIVSVVYDLQIEILGYNSIIELIQGFSC